MAMKNYFEGWYFKQQTEQNMLALIPACHADSAGIRTGSIQVITKDKSWFVDLPGDTLDSRRRPLSVRAGDNVFTLRGIDLNIQSNGLNAVGRLAFTGVTPIRGDIMGPFRFVPFMECRHSVFSMTHRVDGHVAINGETYDFNGGVGYTEGDRGRSFPKRYVWAQCCWFDGGPCSLMISAADVTPLGREFIGVIGVVFLRGRELRLATYRGARVVSVGGGSLIVRQGAYTLTARLFENGGQPTDMQTLHAPQGGEMVRTIRERLSCRARFTLTEKDDVLFDFETDQASFEYEF
jgi:hypothetical protein